MKKLLQFIVILLGLFGAVTAALANAGIFGAPLVLNGSKTRQYGSSTGESAAGFTLLTTSIGPNTKQLLGAEAYGFANSNVYNGVVNNDVTLYYNVHTAGQSAGTFASFAMPNSGGNSWRKVTTTMPVVDLLAIVNKLPGNYVLEWYLTYTVQNTDNNTSIATRFPQTGNHLYTFQINTPAPLADTYPKFFVDGKLIRKKTSAADAGTVFTMKGININGSNWNWDFRNNLEDSLKIVNTWGFNAVRINCFLYSYQKAAADRRFWVAGDDGKLAEIIRYFSGKGVVCMIEAHDNTGDFPPSNAAQDTVGSKVTIQYLSKWWKNKALEYRNNQYVWFNIQNEPGFTSTTDYAGNTSLRDKWKALHKMPIDSIRSTGAPNIIVADAVSYASEAVGYGTVLDASPHRSATVTAAMSSILTDGVTVKGYDSKSNVVFALHPYTGWETPGKFQNFMDLVNTAGLPVIVAEAMPVFRDDPTVGWQAGWGSRALWDVYKYYRNTGSSVSSGWMIWHWDGAGKQLLSYNGGATGANSTSPTTRPTNLSREGYWTWDMLKNNAFTDYISVPASGTTRLQIEQAMGWKDAEEYSPNGAGTDDRYTGSPDANAWTEWDINVASAGTYRVTLRGYNKNATSDATFEVRNAVGTVIGTCIIPANTTTDGDYRSSTFSLSAGQQILRVNRLTGVDAQYTYADLAVGTPDTQAPTVPGSLALFSKTDSTVTVQWGAATDNEGIRGYELSRNGTVVGTTSRTYYADRGLASSTSYAYSVKAIDYTGNKSAASSSLSVGTIGVKTNYSVDNKTTGTGLNQVQFSATATGGAATDGWYEYSDAANFGGSEHYTTQTNARIQIQFSGTQVRIYGTRKSSHGEMMVSIDGGTEYAVAASFVTSGVDQRATFIWASPELTNATHTVKLRNLGSYVSFDRAVVVTEALGANCAANGNGKVLWEKWNNVQYGILNNIPVNTTPSTSQTLTSLESPQNTGDSFGVRIRTNLIPCETGSHTFYIASDNNSELYLSTSSDPASKTLIASVNGYCSPRQWTKYSSQQSTARTLTAGTKYYLEVRMGDDTGSDNLAVGWTTPSSSTISVIGGTNIDTFVDPDRPVADGVYEILNGRSQAIDIQSSSTAEGGSMQQYFNNHTAAQKFTVSLVSAPWYKLVNNNSTKAVTLSSDITSTTTVVQKTFVAGNDSFLWKFEAIGTTGFYKITNKRSGLVISAQSAGATADPTADGTLLVQRAFNTTTAENGQKWQFTTAGARRSVEITNAEPSPEPVVYPNPTKASTFRVRSMHPVEQMSLHTANGNRIGIDWRADEPGTYLVKAQQPLVPGVYVLRLNDSSGLRLLVTD
ncbi:cellulase family glycosylhydrolase [Fibrella aquatilis]|uniref:Cellulase family glycosylhydrolase n=1 Tax=Fibrella aquatilis TaxID=2817059 RepID=A0A939G6B5_9BACT|nr:cellulase family glycosylhydrolase [Fibrella aquatilis]MBO0932008.1 cellulase family glycosylhydrolase [Fibrella aquatilis]